MLRLSWTRPEDLVPHGLAAAEFDGRDVAALRTVWAAAGGHRVTPVDGVAPVPARPTLRALARRILVDLDAVPDRAQLLRDEPDDLDALLALAPAPPPLPAVGDALDDRIHGAWLGRAAGCLLGKPVEMIPRAGIRAIAESTDNWPIRSYFTAVGLDPAIAARYPWAPGSRSTSLVENIAGMPEDDDMDFPLIALDLVERFGTGITTTDVARSWLRGLPGGRVFTAERIVYRNLLDGYEPEVAGRVRNPFRDWIGAQIRTDVYGWVSPGDPRRAVGMAWQDAALSHGRSGLYGALFVAAAGAAALVADRVDVVIEAGLSAVPEGSRFAAAVRHGAALGRGDLSLDEALDALHARYGYLHWIHTLNNSALLAFALTRGGGDLTATIAAAVAGGWDTDSVGATAGALVGALVGARALPPAWIEPLQNRLSSSVPGFDGIGFDDLARRTRALVPEPPDALTTEPERPAAPR